MSDMAAFNRLDNIHTIGRIDSTKRDRLVDAYRTAAPVPPVLVIAWDGGVATAIGGAHRIAAIREIMGGDTTLSHLEYRGLLYWQHAGDIEIAGGKKVGGALLDIKAGVVERHSLTALLPALDKRGRELLEAELTQDPAL